MQRLAKIFVKQLALLDVKFTAQQLAWPAQLAKQVAKLFFVRRVVNVCVNQDYNKIKGDKKMNTTVLYIKKSEDDKKFVENVLKQHTDWEHISTLVEGDAYKISFKERELKMQKLEPSKEEVVQTTKEEAVQATKEEAVQATKEKDDEDTSIEEKFESILSSHVRILTNPRFREIKQKLTDLEKVVQANAEIITKINARYEQLLNSNASEHKLMLEEQGNLSANLQKVLDTLNITIAKEADEHNRLVEWKTTLLKVLNSMPVVEKKVAACEIDPQKK